MGSCWRLFWAGSECGDGPCTVECGPQIALSRCAEYSLENDTEILFACELDSAEEL